LALLLVAPRLQPTRARPVIARIANFVFIISPEETRRKYRRSH
jgi:hypothetical protein